MDPGFVPTVHKSAMQFYTPDLADRILELFLGGSSLLAISKLPEMPAYATFFKWFVEHPEFKEKIQVAREMRALAFEEMALEMGASLPDAREVPGARLAFDTYKWLAEVNDPSRYGKRMQVSAHSEKSVTFIISTGFPDLTPEQRQPLIGRDGLIQRTPIPQEARDETIDDPKA